MYVIKDTKYNHWLKIDRVVDDLDIVTCVEPVYNYNVASQFSTEAIADRIIEQIKSEGQYETDNYVKENVDDLKAAEQKEKEEFKQKIKDKILENLDEFIEAMKAKGYSDEQIEEAVKSLQHKGD